MVWTLDSGLGANAKPGARALPPEERIRKALLREFADEGIDDAGDDLVSKAT